MHVACAHDCIGLLDLLLLLVSMDLLLACSLANATCAITLIFIILIVYPSDAFILVVVVRSSLHVLVVVGVIPYFQHSVAEAVVLMT